MHSFINNRKVPQILSIAAKRVEEWSIHSWKWLSRLRIAVLKHFKVEKRLSTRTMRVDQREAITALVKVMLSHLDLKTMHVGVYNPETDVFAHLSLDYLAHKAGLALRRAQRAMAWLYDSGYVIAYRQSSYDLETEEYHHKPSIRRISNCLLEDLGITELAFQRARNKSRKNNKKILITSLVKKVVHPSNPNKINTIKDMFSSIIKNIVPSEIQINARPSNAYTEKIKKLMTIMPELSFSEAKRMLPCPNTYK